jgi:hypothetical protein
MKQFFASLVLAASAFSANAQTTAVRNVPIPDAALRGAVTPAVFPLVSINGKAARLAPGARIFGPNNLLVLPTSVPAQAQAAFVFDQTGNIQTMWLLTEEEQKIKRKNF